MSILDLAKPVIETVNSVNVLIHGDSGVGKTVFAGSGRNDGEKDLIIAIEKNGTISAARSGSKASVIQVSTLNEMYEIISAIEDEPDRFEWVVIDSITKLQDLIWTHIVEEATSRTPGRSKFKKELQEYGEAQERLKEIVERLNNSDANTLWTAVSDLATDENGNEFKMPSIHGRNGQLAAWICAQMDTVVYLSVVSRPNGQVGRMFQFNKSPEAYAKDRLQTYPEGRGNLTLAKFTNKILNVAEEPEAK